MTSFPVSFDKPPALLCPMVHELYCCGEDRQRQVVVMVALPANTTNTSDDVSVPHGAMRSDQRPSPDSDCVAASTRNPVFGKSKSPKSYWLRRHSDSAAYASSDCDVTHAPASQRTVSDSRSTSPVHDHQPHWLQSSESDDVFDEVPQNTGLQQHSHGPTMTQSSVQHLEDIDEENQLPGVMSEQPLSDSVRLMELGADDERKSTNVEEEMTRQAAGGRVMRSPVETSGGKVHRCAVCRRTFSRSDMLERHARLHTGVRPYACRLCTQVFSRSDHLTTHLRTHTGEKPYSCPRCAYTASRRDMVTRHLRVHQTSSTVDTAVIGPARRRVYRSRYKQRPTLASIQRASPPLLGRSPSHVQPDQQRLSVSWPPALTMPLPSPSPPASQTQTAYRRRLQHIQALHTLPRSVVARGSTGSTDSYNSPGCLSASDMFECGSPDVFRSPSSTSRHSTVFLFPYTTPSDSF